MYPKHKLRDEDDLLSFYYSKQKIELFVNKFFENYVPFFQKLLWRSKHLTVELSLYDK